MGTGIHRRLYLVWSYALITVSLTRGEKQAAGRKSRQALEREAQEGVWGPWTTWTDCSQSCGVGVSERRRQCLPPPRIPQTWGAPSFLPQGLPNHTPVISAIRPYYPSQYPDPSQFGGGERPPFFTPALRPNQNPGISIYRTDPGAATADRANPAAPFYRPEFPPPNQEPVSIYRPPSFPSSSLSYGQRRASTRTANHGAGRAGGGGSRRSAVTSRDAASSRRSASSGSPIRPGQFGYGRVPFSLPLLRPNRNARHAARRGGNGTTAAPEPEEEGPEGRERPLGADGAPAESGAVRRRKEEGEGEGEGERGNGEEGRVGNREAEGGGGAEDPGEGQGRDGTAGEGTASPTARAEPPQAARPTDSPPDGQGARESPRQTGVSADTGGSRQTDRQADRNPGRQAERYRPTHGGSHAPRHPQTNRDRQTDRRVPPPVPPPFSSSSVSRFSPHREPPHSLPASLPLSRPRSPQHTAPPDPDVWLPQHPGGQGEGGPQGGHAGGHWGPHVAPQHLKCRGPEKEYRRCSEQSCPGRPVDPRAEQCSVFDSQEFMGRLYTWEPFTEVGQQQQCELTCRPAGFRFYVRQADAVRDGTPCANTTANDVCVGGRCLSEGCDGVLGSGLVRDRCGVCGGRDASCRRVTGSFQNASVPLGYHRILDIPPGATAINITERRASPNYLALRSGTGQSVVNGRWAVDPPGEYQAGGTTFLYSRPWVGPEGQEEGAGEKLTAPGPTTTLLQLYIIYHRQNPGIDYEFYIPAEKSEGERERARERDGGRAALRDVSALMLAVEDPLPLPPPPSSSSERRWSPERPRPQGPAPNRHARIPPRTDLPLDTQRPFVWRRGELTKCSASCGKGFQHRAVYCVDRHTEQEVLDRKCDSATRPTEEEEPCNVQPCPPFWEMGSWSDCSVSCGWGVQQRQLQCRQSFGNRSTMVHPQRCALLSRPNATQPCHPRTCSHWEIRTNWSTCSVDCGVGKRTRNVRCVSNHGSVVNDHECNSRLRPQGSEDCHMGPCVTNWYFTDWSYICSAECGPGVQRRQVVCLTRGGGREGEGGGGCAAEKPADMKACNGGPCEATHLWYTGPWGQCSVPCGNGTQRRDIICVQKLGNDFNVAPADRCARLRKPSPVQTCETEPCSPQWFTTDWTACSRSCGKGLQAREVRCLTADNQYSADCDLIDKPEQEQTCNIIPCSPHVPDENCRDKRPNCAKVAQARLCVYSFYKTACCASCTHSAQRARRH
ncbi:ADAMTS-like protein 4 [Anguilla anguilla]|uniref:ADAMTS-like protein 4 n=1 Tax=Anguilla anguilla TaxID=7936 RepID=UPI0015A92092|nr:ADAMTS-like protein 4 [Anguilla anguilla]